MNQQRFIKFSGFIHICMSNVSCDFQPLENSDNNVLWASFQQDKCNIKEILAREIYLIISVSHLPKKLPDFII